MWPVHHVRRYYCKRPQDERQSRLRRLVAACFDSTPRQKVPPSAQASREAAGRQAAARRGPGPRALTRRRLCLLYTAFDSFAVCGVRHPPSAQTSREAARGQPAAGRMPSPLTSAGRRIRELRRRQRTRSGVTQLCNMSATLYHRNLQHTNTLHTIQIPSLICIIVIHD